jgi:hypothetical protein
VHLIRRPALLWAALACSAACTGAPAGGSEIAIVTVPTGLGGEAMLQAAAAAFYAGHPDDYDMLVLWPSRSLPGGAYYLPVANDVLGIGYGRAGASGELFDRSAEFDSARLQGIVHTSSAWPAMRATGGHDSIVGLLAQETGHRWAASVYYLDPDGQQRSSLVGAGGVHWSFFVDSGGSPLGGNHWVELGDGRYRATPGPLAYSPLDLYLMGLLPAAEVPPIQRLVDAAACPELACTGWGPTTTEIELAAAVESISIDQVIAAEGPRVPAAGEAPRVLRQAWLYVLPAGDDPDPAALDYLDELRPIWEQAFAEMTGGLGAVRTDLLPD